MAVMSVHGYFFSRDFNCGLKSLEVSWFCSGRFVVFF